MIEAQPNPENNQVWMTSPNSENLDLSGGVADTTVRPMRESLRKQLEKQYGRLPLRFPSLSNFDPGDDILEVVDDGT
jgi:hypothetical protein